MVGLRELLETMVKKNASDLHLTVGSPPQMRIDGKLIKTSHDLLTPEDTKKLQKFIRIGKFFRFVSLIGD